ncbi:MAG TPA: UDP-N-acetylmuramate--L-alanine ligase [Aquificaceae bacterium]|nr:UDP-N-acetylmuramate--L-alanine ligase [Aquificaceae bacterium]HIQ48250.1 UDP-N-acetylmuramate--L-alanine ligase [Aquifex aeolicus]
MLREKIKKFHFIGIGGIGMSGIAQILLEMGYKVSGSDIKENRNTELLRKRGAKIFIGHRPQNLGDAQVVVYSSAVKEDNPEIQEARRRNIPVIPRGEMLAELFKLKEGIAVSGSHGKTTTTSMIAEILINAGLEPTVIVGGRLKRLGTNAKLGRGDILVSEADESDGSFLKLSPAIAVVTNVDREHLDFYRNFDEIKIAFEKFINCVPFYGFAVVNTDDETLRKIVEKSQERIISYGIENEALVMGKNLRLKGGRYEFDVEYKGQKLGSIHLGIAGKHNVYNALASVSVALELEIPFGIIKKSLEDFRNAERRLDLKGFFRSSPVYDDYGHHPTEIKAVISSLRDIYPDRKLLVIFQPHRYSRTYYLFSDFVKVLKEIEKLLITDIFPASEENIYGVDVKHLAAESGGIFVKDKEDAFEKLINLHEEGDVILFLGAGSISKWCEEFLKKFSDSP